MQVGRQQYDQYLQRGEIVPSQSPLYAVIDPIGDAIAAVANAQYFAPFHFLLLAQPAPNAFSMPGGNVYVTTGMLSLLKNRDELAGVLCHEVNHDIHHDMYNVYQLTGGAGGPGDPQAASYERAAETNADRAGAYLCAKAGFNPWGMVWNFRLYRQMTGASHESSASSDHPSDQQRVADLIALFDGDKATFGRFQDDVADAQPLSLPYGAVSRQQPYPAYPPYAPPPPPPCYPNCR